MTPGDAPAMRHVSKAAFWTGWVLTILPAGLLAFSGAMKLSGAPELAEGFEHLGWPLRLAVPLAVLELGCVAVFLVPRTAALGAILITGYMGGAIATHVRVGDPFYTQVLVGVAAWLAVYLREPRLRAVAPWRRAATIKV